MQSKAKNSAVAIVGRLYRPYSKTSVRLLEAISQSDCNSIQAVVTLLYRKLHTDGYDTVIRRTCVIAANSNFAFKIAADRHNYH